MFLATLDELRVGDMVRKDIRVRVTGERDLPGIDFILGDDFFKELEIEFDYAKGVIRLFRAQDCQGVSLSYWDRNAQQVPLEDGERLFLPSESTAGRRAPSWTPAHRTPRWRSRSRPSSGSHPRHPASCPRVARWDLAPTWCTVGWLASTRWRSPTRSRAMPNCTCPATRTRRPG
jgi:hypothetical protein